MIYSREDVEGYKKAGFTRKQALEYMRAVDAAAPVHGWEGYQPRIEEYFSDDPDIQDRDSFSERLRAFSECSDDCFGCSRKEVS